MRPSSPPPARSPRAGADQALAAAGAGSFIAYPERDIMRCSRAALKLLGLPQNQRDLKLADWIGMVHPAERDDIASKIRQCIERVENHTIDYRVALAPGRSMWVRVHAIPVRDAAGRVVVYGALLDITQVKSLERDVLARDARLRDVSVAARFYMWELNLETMQYSVDRPVLGAAGAAHNETYINTVEQADAIHHPEDRHILRAMIERIRHEDVPYEVEARVMHPDGTYHWMLAQGKVAVGAGPRRVLGIIQDINNRKRAALRLQAVEARLNRVIRGSNDGMWELQCESLELWIAPRTAQMLGYEASELVSPRQLMQLVHPDEQAALAQIFQGRFEPADYLDMEVRLRNKAGEYRLMRLRGFCERDASGVPISLSGSLQDITEHRAYQQALIDATVAANAASKAKSDFLANMSHEIRTPMNGVLGMTELLLGSALNPEQRDYAQTVQDSASALLTIINDILDFSKIEAGKLEIEHADMSLQETVESAVRLLAIQAHAKNLELIAEVDPAIPTMLRGDAGRVRQILLNLGGNAVKFTSAGEVTVAVTALQPVADRCIVRFEVRDTGIGIPASRVDSLFQPFSQVDASTTRRFGGTGLGLSIVRRLVALMEGDSGVASTEGQGSTFWFSLPFDCVAQPLESQPQAPTALRGHRVLVVESNRASRRALACQLAQCGVEVLAAGSVHEGLDALSGARPGGTPIGAALMGVEPVDGEELRLIQTLVAQSLLGRDRLVLLTRTGKQVGSFALAQAFGRHLTKPVAQHELEHTLRQVLLGGQATGSPQATDAPLPGSRCSSARGARVLLAEDNEVNQKVACRALQQFGHHVEVVSNGNAAVKAWRQGSYDLILMDCQMPELDGYEATRKIRELEANGSRIPIIALTAHAMSGAAEECYAAGMDAHLTKPIDRVALKACIDGLFAQGHPQRPSRRANAAPGV